MQSGENPIAVTFDNLSHTAKVQFLVDGVDTYDFPAVLMKLREFGDGLNTYAEARRYILRRIIAIVDQMDKSGLDSVYESLLAWLSDLGPLPYLDNSYAETIVSIAEDVVRHG